MTAHPPPPAERPFDHYNRRGQWVMCQVDGCPVRVTQGSPIGSAFGAATLTQKPERRLRVNAAPGP
jgi:hypothetical protein